MKRVPFFESYQQYERCTMQFHVVALVFSLFFETYHCDLVSSVSAASVCNLLAMTPDALATNFSPILVRWSPVATRRALMNDVPQHMDVYFLVLEPSTQIWNRTRNPAGERAQNLYTALGQVVTSSYTVQGRSLLRFTPCSLVMKFLLPSISLTHLVRVVLTGRHFPLFPKILRSLRYQFASKTVRPWCQPRLAQFLAKRKCRAAEFSEYFEGSRLSRWTFFGTVFCTFTCSCAHGYLRDCLLDVSRPIGLAAGNPWHAGGWHSRRKPRVALLLRLFFFKKKKCLTEF